MQLHRKYFANGRRIVKRICRRGHSARNHAMRFGIKHSVAQKRKDNVNTLLTELVYLEARVQAGASV